MLMVDSTYNLYLASYSANRELSDKKLFQTIITKYKTQFLQKINVSEIILFESILLKQGATYRIVNTFKL